MVWTSSTYDKRKKGERKREMDTHNAVNSWFCSVSVTTWPLLQDLYNPVLTPEGYFVETRPFYLVNGISYKVKVKSEVNSLNNVCTKGIVIAIISGNILPLNKDQKTVNMKKIQRHP